MYCTKCGSLNSNQGKFCIQCGQSLQTGQAPSRAPEKPRKRHLTILKWVGIVSGGLVGLFLVLIVLAAIFGESDDGQVRRPATIPPPTPTPIPVTAGQLSRDKDANEVAWERKYLNKYARISGEVLFIEDAGDKYDVKLNADFLTNIVCKVSKSRAGEAKVLQLRKGNSVQVLGRVTDRGIIDIVVEDCSIQSGINPSSEPAPLPTPIPALRPTALYPWEAQPTPSQPSTLITTPQPTATPTPASTPTSTQRPKATSIQVTAGQLSRDKEANEVAWERKYLNKYALISGEVFSIEDVGGEYDVKLDADFLSNIVCKVSKSRTSETEILQLRKGNNVRVLGKVTDRGVIDIVVEDCTIQSGANPSSEPATG